MRMRHLAIQGLLLAGLMVAGPVLAQGKDCELAKRYVALAKQRAAAFETDQERVFLRQSIEACPTYEAHERLGELGAQSSETAELGQAAESFVEAIALAPDSKARAHSLHQYAKLLTAAGDPQNAWPLITEARTLAPQNTEIRALEQRIGARIQNPSEEDIVRGIKGSLYKPIRVTSAAMASVGAARPAVAAIAHSARPSINVPINFVTGTTSLDERSLPNLEKLARALMDSAFTNQRFVFVGHADVRGDGDRNLQLSRERAQAVYGSLLEIEPSLAGRVEVVGRGAAEPLTLGRSEEDHRANRRLQVYIK
jgi:outer membrane protein OmpA-like peptidoglycan-associated protein